MSISRASVVFVLTVFPIVSSCMGDVIFETSFDSPDYALGTIAGQHGWTTEGAISSADVVDAAKTGHWEGHGRNLYLNAQNGYAIMPKIDTGASDTVKLTFEVRPADWAKAANTWASAVYVFDDNNKAITSVWFIGDGVDPDKSEGYIAVSNAGTAWWNTGLNWEYVNHKTTYKVSLTIKTSDKSWSISVNGSDPVTGKWGTFMGYPISQDGTASSIWFRGGLNRNPGGVVSYDNIKVETTP